MAGYRTAPQRDKDRADVAQWTLQGKTQYEIAALLNISQSQVSRDLAHVRAQWQEHAKAAVAEQKALEVAKVNNLEGTRWEAWKRTDDPRHLNGVEWCIERRCVIYGVDAPKKVAPTTPDGETDYDPTATARNQLVSKLTALFAAHVATTISSDDSGDEQRGSSEPVV